jgi:nucleoside-diphosphate-sugar epimerase
MILGVTEAGADGPVNIGTRETISLHDLTALICEVAALSPRLVPDPTKPEGRFVKSADMSRFETLVPGFRPTVDLRQGLARMVGWYRDTFPSAPPRPGAQVAT